MKYYKHKNLKYIFNRLDEKKTIKIIPVSLKEMNSIFYLNTKIIYLNWVKKSFKSPKVLNFFKYKSFIKQYFN